MNSSKNLNLPETKRRSYAAEEIDSIYSLGRLFLTSGNIQAAENVFQGLLTVAPDYANAWLGISYINGMNHNHDAALFAARQAVRIEPTSIGAQLFLIACLLSVEDYNTAGTYLGEVGDRIDSGAVDNAYFIKFYKSQILRYQNR